MLKKRTMLLTLSFICVFTVIILGNLVDVDFSKFITNKYSDVKGLYNENKHIDQKNIDEQLNKDDLAILVDIDRKYLYVLDTKKNKVIKKYIVATGKPSTPTPTGTYKIIQKAKWGGGFGSRWMRLNVPWGQYGIHGTDKPNSIGYNASYGCVRMRNKDIEELYKMIKYNTTVVLYRGIFGPFGYGFRILAPGDRGEDVKEVQKRLKMKGYYYGALDGIYGNGMKMALMRFLKDNDMPMTDRIGYSVYKKLGIVLME
ncbi:L,D-transpeptidase family protein [Caldisalinibacter kiritimatiensis]|uniref:Putative peptidoglycan binding protein n=1 Tax=Caldisalinibacter kiritimatiensis TaxID=1304284 RepID=R1AV46_9FIRM|nr:L,D-transpeptidase family protein [Caldisalinibacter kiritimatiensis]EOD01038.1 putative peptidoglycan binding protein [Caldisalinibacter kiritimatiensis]